MAWRVFQSHHLNGGDYDPQTKTLTIQFVNGAVHNYHGVPQTIADTLFQSSSPGSYFHAKIRGKYSERQMAQGVTKSGRRSQRRF
jgi:hypothetical protein